ncbi:hypothetical protein FJU11_10820 [Pararhizobium mangrovi]|uniref:Preprotein translocase subunit SecD n=2 Tax=Pararhizobium mangrovi TaxID=2590452 RepID=A0A506U422_9HYPH|nr:hypothetical protein FJU11_10820 [Pararhizobium mangrovi]
MTDKQAPQRPEDVLPDGIDRIKIDGVAIRKGTVAAFVRNAIEWRNPATDGAHRQTLEREMTEAMPALRALGLFEVFDLRDQHLNTALDGCKE